MRKHTIPTPYMVGDVHVYSTEIGGELVLFDTGPNTPQAREYLQRQLELERLRHVFVTHCHVDHYGLASFLAEQTGASIYLPHQDALKFRYRQQRQEGLKELLLECGFDRSFVESFHATVNRNQIVAPQPETFRIVEESPVLEALGFKVLACPGHSQSDLVYYSDRCAITGDLLLRGIFQVPLLDLDLETLSGRFRNYEAYCRTLLKLDTLRGLEILPSHRDYIDSLEEAILFYVGKLVERAGRIQTYPGHWSAARVVENLPGQGSDPFVAYLKVSEVLFIRDFLHQPDRLFHSLDQLGLLSSLAPRLPASLALPSGACR